MTETKTVVKRGAIQPGNDVNLRYLQGSVYSTPAMKNTRRSSGGVKKRGKKKNQVLHTPFTKGCDSKGWVLPCN